MTCTSEHNMGKLTCIFSYCVADTEHLLCFREENINAMSNGLCYSRVYQNYLSENIILMAKCSVMVQKTLVFAILEEANTHNKQYS